MHLLHKKQAKKASYSEKDTTQKTDQNSSNSELFPE